MLGSTKLGMMTLRNATKMSEPWLGKLGNKVKVNKGSNMFISQTMEALLVQESSPTFFTQTVAARSVSNTLGQFTNQNFMFMVPCITDLH
jgi:hypothetical protein